MSIPESSWGAGGGHATWHGPETQWMWNLVHDAELQMEHAVARYSEASGERLDVLNQAGRELALLESSDWPFLISTGQAKEYAGARFQSHLARFRHLLGMAENDRLADNDRRFLENASALDNPFPTLDYRIFADREGRKEPATVNA